MEHTALTTKRRTNRRQALPRQSGKRAAAFEEANYGDDPRRRRSRWFDVPLWCLTRLVLPVFLLAAIGAGVLYVRLLNGPISLKSLAEPIARAIEADLGGFRVEVEEAAVRLTATNGFEFHLQNVKLADPDGIPVALAPVAAVGLSTNALWQGRIAPERVVLIEPRLLLLYSKEKGLALSFARTGDQRLGGGGPAVDRPAGAGDTSGLRSSPGGAVRTQGTAVARDGSSKLLDMGRTIALLAGHARRGDTAASFLKRIGLRNATLIIDNAGRQAFWRVTEAEFGLNHRRKGNVFDGSMTLATNAGRWQLKFVANDRPDTGAIDVDANVTGFAPRSISSALPEFAAMSALDFPLDGRGALVLSQSGELIGADLDLLARRGAIRPPWQNAGEMPIEGGRFAVRYRRNQGYIEIAPSRLSTGASHVTMAGRISVPRRSGEPYNIEISAIDGVLADASIGLKPSRLESMRLTAKYDAGTDVLAIDEAVVKVAGAEASMKGVIPMRPSAVRMSLSGQLSPMTSEQLLRLWPPIVAPAARNWSGLHVRQGRLVSGSFVISDPTGVDAGRIGADGIRMTVSLVGEDMRIKPRPDLPEVIAPRALVRLEGNSLEIAAPDAVVLAGPNRLLPLKGVRMLCADVSKPTAIGDLTFRAVGPLQAALDAVPERLRRGHLLKMPDAGIDGRIEVQVSVTVPLGDRLSPDDVRLSGKGRVIDGKMRDVLGSYDIQGAALNFEISDQVLNVTGEMLFGGVSTKVTFGRFFSAAEGESQPPIVLRTILDTADRAQLKLEVNDLVQGEVPVEVKVGTDATTGEAVIDVSADLTKAELVIESLAWKKSQGRKATLQFEARPGKSRTELRNFRVVGEDIAVGGSMTLDQNNRIIAFSLPDFSLSLISRLRAEGVLRAKGVWDVKVGGTTFDGRDLFQSLFSVGQIRDKPLAPSQARAALELTADIDNVIGFHDLSLKDVSMRLSKRAGRMVGLKARGMVTESQAPASKGKPLDVEVRRSGANGPRHMIAESDDAGQVFRLVGFYPNMDGGQLSLDVNLEGRGAAEKTGLLQVRRFQILGDPVAYEPAGIDDTPGQRRGARKMMQRPVLPFDYMRAPFSVGHGQFVIDGADLRGPVLGVVLKGKADFRARYVDLGGTYVPLQGLNSAIGGFPILGQILAGPRGEGVLGMTFAIQGPMARPQVLVNPVSFGLPGILREMMQMTDPTPRVTPRREDSRGGQSGKGTAVRSSSHAVEGKTWGDVNPKVDPDGGWSSRTVPNSGPQD